MVANHNSYSQPGKLMQSSTALSKIILFNKPYGVMSQFSSQAGDTTLADFIQISAIYPAGRLDKDSEGLLLLTDNGRWQHWITHPSHKMTKTYWAQVEGIPSQTAINQLRQGVLLNDGITQPARVKIITEPTIWQRDPPIRFRKHIPTTWLAIQLQEGRNRQIRRMTASIGYPTLRLIRYAIGQWTIAELPLGKFHSYQLTETQFKQRFLQNKPSNNKS